MQSDLHQIDLPENVKLDRPNKDDVMNFHVTLVPSTGHWKGATFTFKFAVPDDYPYTPPKITCLDKVIWQSSSPVFTSFFGFLSFPSGFGFRCADISPQHRPERRGVSQHSTKRLETCLGHTKHHPWIDFLIPGTESR